MNVSQLSRFDGKITPLCSTVLVTFTFLLLVIAVVFFFCSVVVKLFNSLSSLFFLHIMLLSRCQIFLCYICICDVSPVSLIVTSAVPVWSTIAWLPVLFLHHNFN